MTARRLLSLGLLSCTAAVAAPALAQPEMTYEGPGTYEYARPAPRQAQVIYQHQPVIQPVPHAYHEDQGYEVEEVYTRGQTHNPNHAVPYPHQAGGYPVYPGSHAMPPQPAFDRGAWLDQCRAQYRDNRGRRDGGIGGGLLGAAVGGVIGNRVADSDRLAGTLIGAGVGGIAGAVLGSVIGGSGDRRRAADECEDYLDRYLAGGYGQQGHYGYGYPGYGYAMHMTYVPVLIEVPQRAVVRETVTEEWVDVPHHHVRPVKRKVEYRPTPAPKPVKVKTKYVKGG